MVAHCTAAVTVALVASAISTEASLVTRCSSFGDCLSCAAQSHCKFSTAKQACERLVVNPHVDPAAEVDARFDDECPTSFPADPPELLPDWVGAFRPVIDSMTLLDLSLPGTHDTLTYNLSLRVSDGGIDGMDRLAHIMHEASTALPNAVEDFIRANAQTQGLTVTQQLDNGVRFLDFRWMYESEQDAWFSLHFMQSKQPALEILTEVRDWLLQHPDELLVVWLSKHGSTSSVGDDAYPGVDPGTKQAAWADVVALFDGLVVDHDVTWINETSVADMIARGHRVTFYASDYEEFTANSTFALDARLIQNDLGSSVTDEPAALASERACFASTASTKASLKTKRGFHLRSMATGGPATQIEKALKLRFDPFAGDDDVAECAAAFNIPNMTSWCPATLEDVGQLGNYYKQISLDEVHDSDDLDLPNAIYLDGLDWDGTIRTGTTLFNGRTRDGSNAEHTTASFAYVDTFLAYNLRVACGPGQADPATCATLKEQVETRRAAHPLLRWDDEQYGRLADWP